MSDDTFEVELTEGAETDLEAIHAYLSAHRGRDDADALLEAFPETVGTLERFPHRGTVPKELAQLGIGEFRQTLLTPYRIIYRVVADAVYILIIADGRRDMQALLERRLLGGRLT